MAELLYGRNETRDQAGLNIMQSKNYLQPSPSPSVSELGLDILQPFIDKLGLAPDGRYLGLKKIELVHYLVALPFGRLLNADRLAAEPAAQRLAAD